MNVPINALIYAGELDRIAGWTKEYPDRETGGEFFGFFTRSGAPVVQLVLGPAPDSQHEYTSFYQSKDFLVDEAKLLTSTHGLQHLGCWHSHHQLGLAIPSSGDENTVINALRVHKLPSFLLGITNLQRKNVTEQDFDVNLGGFIFTQEQADYTECYWVVLPGESPIRTSLQPLESEFFIDPQLASDWKVKRSSLSATTTVTTTPVQISDRVWYSNPDGLALLKSIYEQFTAGFQSCAMSRTEDEAIYFTFDRQGQTWRVELPHDFPHSPCAIHPDRAIEQQSCLAVSTGSELLATVREFFTNYN